MLRQVLALTLAAAIALPTFAQNRLSDSAQIDAYLSQAVAGKIPGVVAMVADANGVLYSGAFGRQDVAKQVPMSKDSIFRLASMTKPVTSVAVMMLVEEKKVALDDPIAKYLPGFENEQVFTSFNAADKTYTSRPASAPMTVRHLLTHTSGLGYSFSSATLAQLFAGNPGARATSYPLLHDPGTKWTYGESTRVLGDLVAKVSGKPLEEFMLERIFKPLGMSDTSYAVPAQKIGRVATVHRTTEKGLEETPNGDAVSSPVQGDGGLNSTAADYVKFMQMLLHGGRAPDGKRLLSEASVKAMGQTQTGSVRVELQPTANVAVSQPFPLGAGRDTFGLGFQITGAHTNPGERTPGSMAWAGIFNTEFWVDPQRGICAVLLMQYLPFYDAAAIETLQGFERRVYQGLAN